MPWVAALRPLLIVRRPRRGRRGHAGIEACHAEYVAVGEGPQTQEVPREAVVCAPGIAYTSAAGAGIAGGTIGTGSLVHSELSRRLERVPESHADGGACRRAATSSGSRCIVGDVGDGGAAATAEGARCHLALA